MFIRLTTSLFFFLCFVTAHSQLINIKTSVYFETDSFAITPDFEKRLNSFADTAQKLAIRGILLRGNTDSDADSLYNIRLSEKRVVTVKKYLVSKGITDTLIHFDFYGENKPIADNETEKGKQRNRRVDVILSATIPVKNINPKTVIPETIREDTCIRDTTFFFDNGMKVSISLCDFIKRKTCLQLNTNYEIYKNTLDSLLVTNYSKSQVLGAFLGINLCNDSCFEKPLKIEFHIKNECDYLSLKELTLYNLKPNGQWEQRHIKAQSNYRDKQLYYQFEVNCPGLYSLFFCRGTCIPRPYLKIKGGYKIVKLEAINKCPEYRYSQTFNPPKRKIKLFDEVILYFSTIRITLIDRSGDTLRYSYFGKGYNPFVNKPKLKFHFFKRCDCCKRKYPFISLNYNEKIIIRKRFIKRYFIRDGEFLN